MRPHEIRFLRRSGLDQRSSRVAAWVAFLCVAALAGVRMAAAESLSADDLTRIFAQAAARAQEISPQSVIAIVDRDGRALLVRRADGSLGVAAAERAITVSKAGTAVFLSSNEHAFSSRTAGFIIQPHFPPRVLHRPPGPLVGVGFSNMAFSDVNYFRELDGSRIPGTRLYGSPGGVPLFKNGALVAGLGVTGDGTELEDASITGTDIDEAVALAGQIGFAPAAEIFGSHVFIDGIRVPYVEGEARPAEKPAGVIVAAGAPPPAVAWPTDVLGGVPGEVRAPIRGDPAAGAIAGQPRLTAAEVRGIIGAAAARSLVTRAGIRLPAGRAARMFITVVSNPDRAGSPPLVLGTFRTPDATIFSWDVSVQKARTTVFFSSNSRAYSARTIAFLAQPMFPPGLDEQPPGPFNGLQERFSAPILTGVGAVNPNLPNGITLFPGGFPLYRNGVLIGAIAVSGDGIDQDDLIAAAGTVGFQPPLAIRGDSTAYLDVRLPYAKFPRDAELRPAAAALPAGFENLAARALPPGDVVNLSVRGWAAPDAPLILGFVADQSPAVPLALLLRGVGPALKKYAVAGALATTAASLFASSGILIDSNNGWEGSPAADAIVATANKLGAFALDRGSADSAMLTTLGPGAYSMVLGSGGGAAGAALAELYDASSPRPAGALKNVSVRGRVEGRERMLIAGFVIASGGDRTVLIRGIGPALANFGATSPLAAPQFQLVNSAGQIVAEGAPWDFGSNAGEIGAVAAAAGAFPLDGGSADAALLVSLAPGSYTVLVSARDGAAGEVLAEVYQVPR
ncbi:MAG: hypothetical protein EXS32_06660 [Opitutus sp.]|nr:hypothetical protein [Opitutus sp.]